MLTPRHGAHQGTAKEILRGHTHVEVALIITPNFINLKIRNLTEIEFDLLVRDLAKYVTKQHPLLKAPKLLEGTVSLLSPAYPAILQKATPAP